MYTGKRRSIFLAPTSKRSRTRSRRPLTLVSGVASTTIPRSLRGYVRTGGSYGRGVAARSSGLEVKWNDDVNSGNLVGTAGAMIDTNLNLIANGTSDNQRIGKKITVTALHCNGYLLMDPGRITQLYGSQKMRLIVYLDKQCNGAAPNVRDILYDNGGGGVTINSFYNLDNSQRFKILHDKVYILRNGMYFDTVGGIARGYTGRVNIKIRLAPLNIPIEYSGTTGTITEVRSNCLGALIVGEESAAWETIWRTRFKDG